MMNFLKKLAAKRLVEKDGQQYIKEASPFGRLIKPQEVESYLSYIGRYSLISIIAIILLINLELFIIILPSLAESELKLPVTPLIIFAMVIARYRYERKFPLHLLKDDITIHAVLKKYRFIIVATSIAGIIAIILYALSILNNLSLILGVILLFIGLYDYLILKEAKKTFLKK